MTKKIQIRVEKVYLGTRFSGIYSRANTLRAIDFVNGAKNYAIWKFSEWSPDILGPTSFRNSVAGVT